MTGLTSGYIMVLPFFRQIGASAGCRSPFDESLLNLEKIIERKCISRTVEIVGYYSSRFEPIILLYWLLRVHLKTVKMPNQRVFCPAPRHFPLKYNKYSCGKMACSGQKSLAAGHFASFQIHPNTLLHTEINFCAYLMLKPN